MIAAISATDMSSTSNSSSAARWLPGRCCSAATKASSTDSRCSARRPVSGYGPSHSTSVSAVLPGSAWSLDGPRSIGSARRPRPAMTSRQVRVVTV